MRPRVVRGLAAAARATTARGHSWTSSSSRSATPSTAIPLHERIRATIELQRGAHRELARLARSLPARAGAGRDVPQPGARSDVPADRRGEPRRLARGRDREGAQRVLRGLRRRGDRPLLRRGGRTADGRGHGRVARDDRAARRRSSTAGSRCARRSRGPQARSASSSSRCSRASTSPSCRRPSSSTSSSNARSSRSPTATRSTATPTTFRSRRCSRASTTTSVAARRRRGVGGLRPGLGRLPAPTRRGGDRRLGRAASAAPCTSTSRIASGT